MALLTSPDAVPEALRFVVRALLLAKDRAMDESELLGLVAPPGLVESMSSITSNADAGLEDETDRKQAAPPSPPSPSSPSGRSTW